MNVKFWKSLVCYLIILSGWVRAIAQDNNTNQDKVFWKVKSNDAIIWNIAEENKLPHSDNIEMSGEKVSAILHYTVDEHKVLHMKRDVIFPQLRTYIKTSDPEWMTFRAYLRDAYDDDVLPILTNEGNKIHAATIDSVLINGIITFFHTPVRGLRIVRSFYPSMTERLFVEKWRIENLIDSVKKLEIGNTSLTQKEKGLDGFYTRTIKSDAKEKLEIGPKGVYEFAIYFSAKLNDEVELKYSYKDVEQQRLSFLEKMKRNLILNSPDPILNTLFYFSKIRAAESIFDSKMGLVHSPGGGRYYTGIWANDQAEYSGPFFPYLGYEKGNEAAFNAYNMFLKNIPSKGEKIWASFEMQGDLPCCSHDRGDAAMIAYGATQFALASGDKNNAHSVWPLIEWALNYCKENKNEYGVVASDSDELEGRFPSGDANLSTSSLYYGALLFAADLATELKKPKVQIEQYRREATQLTFAIEKYFGANVAGLETYRYYKGNTTLRSWICLPLVMGIDNRKEETLNALFTRLWTPNGVRIEDNPAEEKSGVFWDRGTLYAFRGAFKAGAADRALDKLKSYSNTRLLGFHVPYVVEAWPEGGMAHLSAESALYCRIFTEGIIGLTPIGLESFSIKPQLPSSWDYLSISNIKAFDNNFDIDISRKGNLIQVEVSTGKKIILQKKVKSGEVVKVNLKK